MDHASRLLDRVRQAIRTRHYSFRTEKAYVFSFAYSAWRKGQPLTRDVWPDGVLWGVSLAAFSVVAGRVLAHTPAKPLDTRE